MLKNIVRITRNVIRTERICTDLEKINNFVVDGSTMEVIMNIVDVSNLNNAEIRKEILEAHSLEQLIATM